MISALKARGIKDLYVSPLFVGSLRYARALAPDTIFMLSAKHGLLGLNEDIEPNDLTLRNMSAVQVRVWAADVLAQLRKRTDLEQDHFVFLAGDRYRKYLMPHMVSCEVPMQGLGIGRQLRHLAEHTYE